MTHTPAGDLAPTSQPYILFKFQAEQSHKLDYVTDHGAGKAMNAEGLLGSGTISLGIFVHWYLHKSSFWNLPVILLVKQSQGGMLGGRAIRAQGVELPT